MKKLFAFFDSHSTAKTASKLILDGVILFASYLLVLSVIILFSDKNPKMYYPLYQIILSGVAVSILTVLTWALAGKHKFLWQGPSNRELLRLMCADIYLFTILFIMSKLFRAMANWFVPGGTIILSTLVLGSAISLMAVRYTKYKRRNGTLRDIRDRKKRRTLIVGAGWAGTYAVTALLNGDRIGNPVVVVDDNESKAGHTLVGVPVRHGTDNIPKYAQDYNVTDIIIAITNISSEKLHHMIEVCKQTNCKIMIMSKIDGYVEGRQNSVSPVAFRELNIADFLSRDEVHLDTRLIEGYIKDKKIIITGGGGSIGSELCRQIFKFQPKKVIIFDIYENCAYELEQEIIRSFGKDAPIKVLIGSIRDKNRLDEVFEKEQPSIVFHAAAHKHVPLMEDSPAEAIKNNVLGTYNLLCSASEHSVERFVQISTDKAVNPTNVMGATKRMCEILTQYFSKKTDMKCMAVRFGNVLGSHGSVIPLFEEQIKNGGPVTITHPDIIRYFMTIPEAAQLVLQAGASDKSGVIYVLDMGQPVKIKDLAENLIRFHGYEPGVEIKIEYIGLRPGEKLYEELLTDKEENKVIKTEHEKIFVARASDFDEENLINQIEILKRSSEHNDIDCVKALARVVTTFKPDYEHK